MIWELLTLAILIISITGVTFFIMRKTRVTEFTSFNNDNSFNSDELATKIAKAIAIELREILKELPKTQYIQQGTIDYQIDNISEIQMDDSLVPTKLETKIEFTNLKNMAKEEVTIDKDLDKAKAKLANLKKRKR